MSPFSRRRRGRNKLYRKQWNVNWELCEIISLPSFGADPVAVPWRAGTELIVIITTTVEIMTTTIK